MTQYTQLESAKGNRSVHFKNLNLHSHPKTHQSLGNYWQIDEETYYEFLGMLPPIYAPGGFYICEAVCDHPTTGSAIHSYFTEIQGTYWCGYAYKGAEPATALRSVMQEAEWALACPA